MEVTVISGNREIVCSGSAIISHGDFLEFRIKNLRIRLSFGYHDEEGRAYYRPFVNSDDPRNTFLELRAFNFNNVALSTLTQPMILAEHDGRSISVSLVVTSVNRRNDAINNGVMIEDKLVSYTWYLDLPQVNQG